MRRGAARESSDAMTRGAAHQLTEYPRPVMQADIARL